MKLYYNVYPGALERLISAGIPQRVSEAVEKAGETEEIYLVDSQFMYTAVDDVVKDAVEEMKEKGFFETLPKEEGEKFKNRLNYSIPGKRQTSLER